MSDGLFDPTNLTLPGRPGAGRAKRIYYLAGDFYGCGWYRCHVPGVALRDLGHEVVMEDHFETEVLYENDVIVLQRPPYPWAVEAIRQAKGMGLLTVYELDDDPWHLDPNNPATEHWGREQLKCIEEGLAAADLVTTTTPYLAKVLSRFNPNVEILPNMVPGHVWRVWKRPEDDRVIIGWAGSRGHYVDLDLLSGVIEKVLDEFPQAEFHLAGMEVYPFEGHERFRPLPSVRLEEYPQLLAGFDIGLAPLADVLFNRSKSDLKFIEYGMAGVAVVGSPVLAYEQSIENEKNGLLAANPREWQKAIRRLVGDPDERARLAAASREFALSRTIERNAWMWERAYRIPGWEETRRRGAELAPPAWLSTRPPRVGVGPGGDGEEVPELEFPVASVVWETPPPVPDMPVSIVMLTYNRRQYTENCLEHLRQVTSDYELVLVDNASTDDTPDYLRGVASESSAGLPPAAESSAGRPSSGQSGVRPWRWGEARVLRNAMNHGFAAGCNMGVAAARHELICLLNNDTYPLPGWLDALRHAWKTTGASAGSSVGAVGAKLLYADGRIQHIGIEIAQHSEPIHPSMFAPTHMVQDPPGPIPAEAVTGACLLTSKSVWTRVGGMDECFIGGQYEDVDFCLKVRDAGLQVIYQPRAVLAHYHHVSFGQGAEADFRKDANLAILRERWRSARLWPAAAAAGPQADPMSPWAGVDEDVQLVDGSVLKGPGPDLYVVSEGTKRRVVSAAARSRVAADHKLVHRIPDEFLERIPPGPPLTE